MQFAHGRGDQPSSHTHTKQVGTKMNSSQILSDVSGDSWFDNASAFGPSNPMGHSPQEPNSHLVSEQILRLSWNPNDH
jgi:hypothetical protein